MSPIELNTHYPSDALSVAISRPFAVGQLTGGGRLYAEGGALVFKGSWPAPGPNFRVVHTDPDVEVQIWRVMFPWIAVEAILHDEHHAVVVTVPIWYKRRLLALMTENGFTPRVRWVWYSTATWRARKWLLGGEVRPKW
jgi:hypothetical protein